ARDRKPRLAGDVELDLGLRGRVLGRHPHGDRILPGADGAGRTHLQLHVLGLAGLDRNRAELLGPVGFRERSIEIRRRLRGETHPLVAGIAAATGWPPPSSVAVHPEGTPSTFSASRSGAWP